MAMSLRIPGLIDIRRIAARAEIAMVAADQRFDRGFTGHGPLINRLIQRRVRNILCLKGQKLPSAAARGDAGRHAAQQRLAARLDDPSSYPLWSKEALAELGKAVRGEGTARSLGVMTQEAVGRLFAADYRADDASFRAAQVLDAAAHTRNPIAAAIWVWTGKVARAQRLLGRLVQDDAAGVHATGIAVHNLVLGFERMRAIWAAPGLRARLSPDAVLARCLVAPPSVLRQATEKGACPIGMFRPGSLVMLALEEARSATPAPEIVFMAGSWARCPAATWVPEFLRAVWAEAQADQSGRGGEAGGS